ncbi:YdgA family protein [Piscinibacter terrae]|nr:DUF945 family protein [Albitalea terrae]
MNKGLIAAAAAVALAGVAVVGGAAVTGSQAMKKIQGAPAQWQAQWPLMKVVDQKYQKSLFSATHTLTLSFGCGATTDNPITIRQTIQHGPLPGFKTLAAAVIDTEIVVPDNEKKAVAALIGSDKSPFTAHTVVGFGGATSTSFSIPSMNFNAPTGEKVAWQGLSGDVKQGGGKILYDVASPGFSFSGKDEKSTVDMKLAALRIHGEMGDSAGSFWLRPGTGEFELVSLDMNATSSAQPGMPPMKVALSQLKASAENKLEGELLSNTGKFSAKGTVNDVRVDKMELQASIKRIHAPTYQRFIQRVIDTSTAACDMKQPVSPQVLMGQMQQDFAALLPHNPEYALDKLAVEIDGKRGEMSYSVGVAGATAADAQLPLMALLMTKGQLRGEAKLPSLWVEKMLGRFGGGPQGAQADPAAQAEMANVMITKFVNDGYLVKDGEMLASKISFEKGQLTVNGKAITPPGAPPQQ